MKNRSTFNPSSFLPKTKRRQTAAMHPLHCHRRRIATVFLTLLLFLAPLCAGSHSSLMGPKQEVLVAGTYRNGLRLAGETVTEAGDGSGCYVAAYDREGRLLWLRLLTDYPDRAAVSLHQAAGGAITLVISWDNQSRFGDNDTEVAVFPLKEIEEGATIKTTSTPVEG